ncbi:MAG: hypothetical protein ACREER_11070 [Alphaproteobacteria bacterium]
MKDALDLIATERLLAIASPRRPKQAELRRAISTAYYALFHAMARDAADLLIGTKRGRSEEAWTQVYRALQHGPAKEACQRARKLGFPAAIRACADAFVELQQARHEADYDPNQRFARAAAQARINSAEQAIHDLARAPRTDRKAFAVLLLLKKPRQG